MAYAGFLKPRSIAVVSVSTTSVAESEVGSRPAIVLMSGELLLGGSETSAPGGGTAAAGDAPSTRNVPVMATSPHAARTCCHLLRDVSVPELKPAPTSPVG